MPLMTQREYAAHKGVTPQYINKLVSQGKIVTVRRKIDSRQADAAIQAWKRPGRIVPARRSAKRKANVPKRAARKSQPEAQPAATLPRDSATRKLTAARAQREHYQAELAKLEYEKAVGNLLPREHVLEAERRKNENIRASFRSLARSLAPVLSRASSPAEIEQVLLADIDVVLDQLARDPLGSQEPIVKLEQLPAPPPIPSAAAAAVSL